MAAKLTPIAVENAKPKRVAGNAVRTEIPDRGCPGLYLVVQSSRAKSWALRYRFKGKSKKLTLGTVADKATPSSGKPSAAAASYPSHHGDQRRIHFPLFGGSSFSISATITSSMPRSLSA
jgi:hypothetical protein